jgi:type IV pilus assembly protein PilX
VLVNKFQTRRSSAGRQRGAILVTSLLLLLVLTIIGITAMQMTRMQERMAGNTRDMNLAFQGAEATLRDGETLIRGQVARPENCSAAPCDFWEEDAAAVTQLADRAGAWWTANALEYEPDGNRVAVSQDVAELAEDPRFVVQAIGWVPDSLTMGHEVQPGRDFYQVTGRSTGGSGNATAVLQSTFTRRF